MRTLLTSKVRLGAAVAVLMLSLTAAHPARADEWALYRKTLQATGLVTVPGVGKGTCWVVDKDRKLVITNKHVVGTKDEATIVFPIYRDGLPVVSFADYLQQLQKLQIKGKVLARDEKRDLALIELERLPKGVRALPLAQRSAAKNDPILSIGNSSIVAPKGQQPVLWKMRTGKVASKSFVKTMYRNTGDKLEVSMLDSSLGTQAGDSGGPVVNSEGELVAVTSGGTTASSLAIDVTEVRAFLQRALVSAPRRRGTGFIVVGTWTMTIKTKDGRTTDVGMTLRPNGTCMIEGAEEFHGTYRYNDGQLALSIPALRFTAKANITWSGGHSFDFSTSQENFTMVRR